MIIENKKLYLLLFILLPFLVIGQNFFGSVVLGGNASQIDGDDAAGFHKYGLTGGFKIDYPIKEAIDLSAELLYSSRGSKDKGQNLQINLHYIEIPFMVSIRDWYIEEEKYDKVRADLGFSFGYLFKSGSNVSSIDNLLSLSKKNDVSAIGGVTYMFNANWGINLRYTRSLYKMLKNDIFEAGGLIGYFVTMRAEYHF